MTEDASPENLRKFLESDDPAMVLMGLSMAKGSGVPEELLPTILKFYMWNNDKNVRAAAKSVFTKYAPTEIKAKVKTNWKPSYRTLSGITPDEFGRILIKDEYPEIVKPFLEAFKSQDNFSLIALEPLIKALRDTSELSQVSYVRARAIDTLGRIGDKRVVKPLIKVFEENKNEYVRQHAAEALGKIGDKIAVEPLIKALGIFLESPLDITSAKIVSIAWALGKIGDKRAVVPLIKALAASGTAQGVERNRVLENYGEEDGNGPTDEEKAHVKEQYEDVCYSAAEALGRIGDKRAVKPLIKVFEENKNEYVRQHAAEALGKIGYLVPFNYISIS